MKKINPYKDREKKWQEYHKFEQRYKKARLSKMSIKESYRIFSELSQIVDEIGSKPKFDALAMNRLKTLARVHAIYGTVKT